jgi:hypothetical protein
MNREQALPYVAYAVDDALSERRVDEMPANARLVGWQCGAEPLFVAVWSYLGGRLDDDEATDLAIDLLLEKNWFAARQFTEPDYIL